MADPVRKVVFPAAGLGTRMLPATKSFPKELLPIVDRPIIQYGVEEAVRSGIREVVLVVSPGETLIKGHFAPNARLEKVLTDRGKTGLLSVIQALAALATVTTVHQVEPRGLGHAVLTAKTAVGDEPFAVVLADDVIDADPPALRQMTDVHHELDGPVLLVERVPHEIVSQYGVIDPEPIREGIFRVRDLVEKPPAGEAPSNLAIVGRYILTPDVFPALARTGEGAGGEIQLTDGLRGLLAERPIYACELQGVRYDAGSMLGFLEAGIHFGLRRPDLGPALREYLGSLK
jgi:UTP--glucose-1-phosphate uridylyltransferase